MVNFYLEVLGVDQETSVDTKIYSVIHNCLQGK